MIDSAEEMIRDDSAVTALEAYRIRRTQDAWKAMLATRNGRRVLWDILGICHFGLSAFAGETNTTLFITGKQKVGEYVMGMMNTISPETFSLMAKEAKEDDDYDRQQQSRSDGNTTAGSDSGR